MKVEVDMVFGVVNNPERGDAAGFQSEVFVHSFFRCERQFALFQPMFQVVYCELLHTVEDDEVVFIAFMVSEEEVFAVSGVKFLRIVQGLLDGRYRRVEMNIERDAEFVKFIDDNTLSFG